MNTTYTVTILGEKNGITKSVIITDKKLRDAVEQAVLSFVNAESGFELTQADKDLIKEFE